MDLSKIPEPSEEDLKIATELLYSPPSFWHDRVIAHLLRHGRVLAMAAKNMRDCRLIPRYDRETEAAISFFDKFGGEA